MPIQKILLVDDSKTELHHLSELLGKRGFEVRTAENGEDAMKRLGEEINKTNRRVLCCTCDQEVRSYG